ncbi:MAG: TSUP family transporter, partial [Gammaproteobacteria bacterium]|nr:TSUP family transporter [Gammaproteobacteria bacterium]NIW99406.1 TSUP family transporter [Phycisphaerae bacterium]
IEISGKTFNRILAMVMIGVVIITLVNPFKNSQSHKERLGKKHTFIGILAFFLIGIYGGFIQAGVGFLIIAALTLINNFSL